MRDDFKCLKKFMKLFRSQWGPYGVSTLMVASRNLAITYLTALISSQAIQIITGGYNGFGQIIVFLAVLTFLFAIFDAIGVYAQRSVTHKIGNILKSKILCHTLHMPTAEMEHLGQRGELIARTNHDIDIAISLLSGGLLLPVMYLISGVGATSILIIKDWKLCVGIYIISIFNFGVQFLLAKRMRVNSKCIQEQTAGALSVFMESYSHSADIKMADLADYAQSLFQKKVSILNKMYSGNSWLSGINGWSQGIVSSFCFWGVICYGILMQRLDLTDTIILSQVAPLIGTMILSFSKCFTGIHKSLVGVERILEILDKEQESDIGKNFIVKQDEKLICVENLECRFTNGAVAFNSLNFEIETSKLVAVSGESGCGKTTLMRLLLGLYPYSKGSLKIMGQEVADCSLTSIREQVAYVPQENIIFSGTIRKNLLWGNRRTQISEEEIMNVLNDLGAKHWVQAHGLDTGLTEGGTNLSGGQRQMLAIARAILYRRPIIILDEAFAGIDEQRIDRILNRLKEDIMSTAIIVTHDKRVLNKCDLVIEM